MAVTCQCFEVFHFPVMQSTFCFPNIAIIAIPAASLKNYFRPKGVVEFVFRGKRLDSASVSENMSPREEILLRLKRDESGKSNLFRDQSYFNCVVSAHLFLFSFVL